MYIFAGPTLHGLDKANLIESNCKILPPVRRGDIEKLVGEHPPAIAVIVDGTFHSYPSVSHMEINEAINMGWKIWGLSSMGAIRAAEMDIFGMQGFGKVYDQYVRDEDFSDDEVTLLHDLDYPFTPLSLPMVQIRGFIESLVDKELINQLDAQSIVDSIKNTWYGSRTKQKLSECLSTILDEKIVMIELEYLEHFDVKKEDLANFLSQKPYIESFSNA